MKTTDAEFCDAGALNSDTYLTQSQPMLMPRVMPVAPPDPNFAAMASPRHLKMRPVTTATMQSRIAHTLSPLRFCAQLWPKLHAGCGDAELAVMAILTRVSFVMMATSSIMLDHVHQRVALALVPVAATKSIPTMQRTRMMFRLWLVNVCPRGSHSRISSALLRQVAPTPAPLIRSVPCGAGE